MLGAATYGLLKSLLAPDNLKDKSLADLKVALIKHFEPKRNKVAERFHFHKRNQKPGESVADYVAELRQLATHCSFEGYLNEALRDRIVCGLRSEAAQKLLLAKGDIDLVRSINIALTHEAAQKDTQALKSASPDVPVNQVAGVSAAYQNHSRPNRADSESQAKCYCCDQQGHFARECRH